MNEECAQQDYAHLLPLDPIPTKILYMAYLNASMGNESRMRTFLGAYLTSKRMPSSRPRTMMDRLFNALIEEGLPQKTEKARKFPAGRFESESEEAQKRLNVLLGRRSSGELGESFKDMFLG